ncbi:host attachment family protein [Wenxinia saemankumensis]|uniref:Protein required for attachment to host cells n=1 Tax=Wenxinia saemankumensis TaxID=1447782 RepID=A0A1M6EP10_9RHOB|nr:host attachment family protein [Wenxinia saemankumensis]SHI87211.1 Protein required for attachment to host cells [Wenxinia saemankumensis]
MTRIRNDDWVVIADGEKALFLRNLTDGEDPNLEVVREESQENPPDREQSANRPGRVGQSANPGKSAYDDTDWHELAKDRFAAHLAEMLYERAHKGQFDRIVICAAPNVLGTLRDHLHKEVQSKVVAEVPKTLTNHPIPEIEKILKSDLAGA